MKNRLKPDEDNISFSNFLYTHDSWQIMCLCVNHCEDWRIMDKALITAFKFRISYLILNNLQINAVRGKNFAIIISSWKIVTQLFTNGIKVSTSLVIFQQSGLPICVCRRIVLCFFYPKQFLRVLCMWFNLQNVHWLFFKKQVCGVFSRIIRRGLVWFYPSITARKLKYFI